MPTSDYIHEQARKIAEVTHKQNPALARTLVETIVSLCDVADGEGYERGVHAGGRLERARQTFIASAAEG